MTSPLPDLGHLQRKDHESDLIQFSLSYEINALEPELFFPHGLELPPQLHAAIKKRKIDFLAGRYCAQLALRALGCSSPGKLPVLADRSPAWPEGFRGSISHTQGFASAIAAPSHRVHVLGLDVEGLIPHPSTALIAQICCDTNELHALCQELRLDERYGLTLIFSAKEALYKALYPHCQCFFGFHDARVDGLAQGAMQITLLKNLGLTFRFGQSWTIDYRILDGTPVLLETCLVGIQPRVSRP